MTESGWLAAIVVVVVVVVVVAAGVVSRIRSAFRARFAHDRDLLLARATPPAPLVTDAELAALPPLLQAYLRRVGVVGRAHVRTLRVTFTAQMRSSATSPWMQATATQYECFAPPARLFQDTSDPLPT